MKNFIGLVMILLLSFSVISCASNNTSYYNFSTANGISFQSVMDLPNKTDIGANPGQVFQFSIPDTTDANKSLFSFTVSIFSDELKDLMANDNQQLMNYGKTTYLASSKPAEEKKERVYQGQTISGDKQKSKIPSPAIIEAYLINTENNQTLFLGFKYSDTFIQEEADRIIDSIFETIKINLENQ